MPKRTPGPTTVRSRPRVALLVETSLAPGRDMLEGISRYLREHESWSLYHEAHGLTDSLPLWLTHWDGDGIIARVQNESMAEVIRSSGLPVVDVLGVAAGGAFPLVHVNSRAIGELAAEHFKERGLRHFGFFGLRDENWSTERYQAFREAVGESDAARSGWSRERMRSMTWERTVNEIVRWVRKLPKPAGVLIDSDQHGPLFLEACGRAGARVPDEVAVLGVDNDETLCEVCDPPLSSIDANHHSVGYEAARLMAYLLRGGTPPKEPTWVEPLEIVPRLSTDMLAVDDPSVTRALQFIRDQAHLGVSVDGIARRVGLSRSVLQRRFRTLLKRTVHEEILSAKIKCAQQLLLKSKLPLATVAARSGFKHQEYMGAVLKARTGMTPREWRNERRRLPR